jgi:hypothetical protein
MITMYLALHVTATSLSPGGHITTVTAVECDSKWHITDRHDLVWDRGDGGTADFSGAPTPYLLDYGSDDYTSMADDLAALVNNADALIVHDAPTTLRLVTDEMAEMIDLPILDTMILGRMFSAAVPDGKYAPGGSFYRLADKFSAPIATPSAVMVHIARSIIDKNRVGIDPVWHHDRQAEFHRAWCAQRNHTYNWPYPGNES